MTAAGPPAPRPPIHLSRRQQATRDGASSDGEARIGGGAALARCDGCGAMLADGDRFCPQCGRPVRRSAQARALGGVLTALGIFLLIVIGILLSYWAPALFHPGSARGGLSGKVGQSGLVLAAFAVVVLLGLTCAITGGWQVATGRHGRAGLFVTLVLGGLSVLVTVVTAVTLPS